MLRVIADLLEAVDVICPNVFDGLAKEYQVSKLRDVDIVGEGDCAICHEKF